MIHDLIHELFNIIIPSPCTSEAKWFFWTTINSCIIEDSIAVVESRSIKMSTASSVVT